MLVIVKCESAWKRIKCYVNIKDHRANSVKGNVKREGCKYQHTNNMCR